MEQIEVALELEKILESINYHKNEGRPKAIYNSAKEPRFNEKKCCHRIANRLQYFWHVKMSPIISIFLGVFFTAMTLLIILFEVTLYMNWDHSSLYNKWTNYSEANESGSFFLANFLCIMPLGYICATSYFGLFKIKIMSFYALHPKQQTDPTCLVYSGMLLMRLAMAVAYNFLELSNVKKCAFFEVMGPLVKINFLGEGFNKWIFPSLLLITILLTAFDCIYRLLNCVGLRQFSFDEDFKEEKVIEGKAVIERYLKKKKQEEELEGKL